MLRLCLSDTSFTAASKLDPPVSLRAVPAEDMGHLEQFIYLISSPHTYTLHTPPHTYHFTHIHTHSPHSPVRLKVELVGWTTQSTVSSDMSPWITVSWGRQSCTWGQKDIPYNVVQYLLSQEQSLLGQYRDPSCRLLLMVWQIQQQVLVV